MRRAWVGGLVLGGAAAALAVLWVSNPRLKPMVVSVMMLTAEQRRCYAAVCPDSVAPVARGDEGCVTDRGNGEEFAETKAKVARAHCLDQCRPSHALVWCWTPGHHKTNRVPEVGEWDDGPIQYGTRSPDAGDGE